MPIDPTHAELDYRANNYPDFEAVNRKQIACATCGTNLSSQLQKPGCVFLHPFMSTLQCKKCNDFYGHGEFSMDDDGDDKYCRMCGNGGRLYVCENKPCPYGFCQKCIKRFLGKKSAVAEEDDWNCLHCNCEPMWEVRAIAAVILLEPSKKRGKHKDRTSRRGVSISDDKLCHSDDSDFASSKRVSLRRSKKKTLERDERISESCNDSSTEAPNKSAIKSTSIESSVEKRTAPKTNNFRRCIERRRIYTTDEDEASNSDNNIIPSKTSASSKKTNTKNPKDSNSEQRNQKINSTRIDKKSESPANSKNVSNDTDLESSHESANDFVKSKRKKNIKARTETVSKKTLTTQKKRSNNSESSGSTNRKDNSISNFVTITTKEKANLRKKLDVEESDEEIDYSHRYRSRTHKKRVVCKTKDHKQDTDLDDENIETEVSSKVDDQLLSCSVSNRKPQTQQTQRLSTSQTTSSSLDHVDTAFYSKKAVIKLLYAKYASTKENVEKSQVAVIQNNVDNLVTGLKDFGKGLSAAADGIAEKHSLSNVTYVSEVSKAILKCSLLIIRCKEGLEMIDRDFTQSYKTWCETAKVRSIFPDTENIEPNTSDCERSTIKAKTSRDIGDNNNFKQDSDPTKKKSNLVETSDDPDDENSKKSKRSPDRKCETGDTKLDNQQTSKHSDKNSCNSEISGGHKKSINNYQNQSSDEGLESSNRVNDDNSECDSTEIFSEDETRGKTGKRNESVETIIRTRSALPRVLDATEYLSEADISMEDIFKSQTVREQSTCEDSDDNSAANGSASTEQLSTSDPNRSVCDGDETIQAWEELLDNNDESRPASPENENQRKTSVGNATTKINHNSDELSDCDEQIIFTQKPTEDSSNNSNADDTVEKANSTENIHDSEETYMSELEMESDNEILLKSDEAVIPSKEITHSPKTMAQQDDEISDSDNNEINVVSKDLEVKEDESENKKSKESKKRKCTAELSDDGDRNRKKLNIAVSEKIAATESEEKKSASPDSAITTGTSGVSPTIIIIKKSPKSNDKKSNLTSKSPQSEDSADDDINSSKSISNLNAEDKDLPGDSMITETKDPDVELNALAKHQLLLSSSDSDSEEIPAKSASSMDCTDPRPSSQQVNVQNDSSSTTKKASPKLKQKDKGLKINSMITETKDSDVEVNAIAKRQLLLSSSDSDSEEIPAKLASSMDCTDPRPSSQQVNVQNDSSSTTENASPELKRKDEGLKINSMITETKDSDAELNAFAKRQLLLSSSDSDSEEIPATLASNVDCRDPCPSSQQVLNENDSTSTAGKRSAKLKKKRFILEENDFYKRDKKLQVATEVRVRRLDESVLDQFRETLVKSKRRQEWEEFQSLVNLGNIKKGKRGATENNLSESSSGSSSLKAERVRKRSKRVQEKEETLLEHLEKMKNGENYCNLSGNESDENNDSLKKNHPGDKIEEELIAHANQAAKNLLIQSSDSENENQSSSGEKDEEEQEEEPKSEKKKKTKEKIKDCPNEATESESNHENGSKSDKEAEDEEKEEVEAKESDGSDSDRTREKKKLKKELSKRNWRLTDSDTSDDEKKWDKSEKSKSDLSIELNKDEQLKVEGNKKTKKKVKRRLLGSDSDSVKLTDQDDSSVEMLEEKNDFSSDSDDSSEIFKNLRKLKKRKHNAKKSGSDDESEEEEKRPKQKRKRIKKMDSESNSDSDNLNNSQDTPGKLHRKNIRKVLKDKQVADVTKIAGKEEEERLKRIAERQKLYNEMYEMKLASEAKVDKLILDFDEETKKELVSVHEDLVNRLKPHQAQGIKFMWDACFESLERTKSTKGSGCIVAHCMGLGKTFQVVTLSHTLLTHAETGIKTIMVICPLSTVLNWVNEFKKWLGNINNDEDVRVFEMTKMKKNFERKAQLQKWKRVGGVMVLGYEMFRLLSNQTGKKMRKSQHEEILKCLVDPGPDLIVCDEGHLLKNEDTALSKAMRRVKTLRRIVLTGTPLQNNLVEYHCMVQFVKPNLLGTKKEFLNRFVNPITNGQFDDSTEYDVKLMKKRAHVLHKMLEGSVQRFDYSVLTPFLPPKQEYVITVRLADIQIKLYQYYLDNLARKKAGAGTSLFADFQALQRIWTHPIVLRMNAEKMEKLNEKRRMDESDTEGSLKDFLDDGTDEKTTSSEDSDIQSVRGSSDEKNDKPDKPRRGTRANPIDPEDEPEIEEPQAGEWWSQFIEPEHFEDLKISSKLILLFAILKESEQIGDKVLVFSQSLYALSLIEEFLNKIDDETQRGTCSDLVDNHTGSWSLGLDYFRLDGQTAPENRSTYCKIFNNPKNSRARLFLISTRAGGLGINLTAANRVIIFDASWNPSHDVQSIFRIYRFGQKKPCYVYRFLAQGTMEEKIYNRQVTKLSLSCRVVDEQQIERHYSNHDLAELYQFEPNTSGEKPTLNLPKDRLLAEIFRKYEDRIETFHEHDSLLENKAEEELDEEERKEAWKEYEDERTGRKVYMNNFQNQNFAMQQYNDLLNMNAAEITNRATLSGINIDTLQSLIQKDYPNSTPEQQKMMTQRAIIDMYTYMENEAIRQQQIAAAASSFNYPTVSNLGTNSFHDKNAMTPAQRQYALQQQQMHQMMVQREQQANYAKRFGNVRGTGLSVTPARPPPVVQIDDNDVVEVPTTPPPTAGPAASTAVSTSSAATPAPVGNRKKQEE